MDKKPLQDIFQQAFDLEAWQKALHALLKTTKPELFAVPQKIELPPNTPADAAFQLGELTTADERLVGLYHVVVNPDVQLEHNKVGLREALKAIYRDVVDGALIAFEQRDQWRLSYVSDVRIRNAQGEIVEQETHPKRFTYLLGKDQKVKTAAERLAALAAKPALHLQDFYDAFSVTPLSKAFFDEYRDVHYKAFVAYLTQSNFKAAAFNGSEKAIRDFVKKLMGRIVFLYFLQKKGWLGASNDQYEDGDPDFMPHLFEQSGKDESFYATELSRLFFDTLNKRREGDDFRIPNGTRVKIPYLNGGLFEKESEQYDFLTFPPELFSELFAFFDRYNFTVHEDSPHEHTVAVDPEMLGHIFENLLEDNKDKGAYYTPKEIVHYMTQASLTAYLQTKLPDMNPQAVENFVKDQAHGLSLEEQKAIGVQLDRVKICDPAIGSGAFPMGLLQEIFALKERIAYPEGYRVWSPARAKEHIIQNAIYGVDIEKGAVDIARLRFWLSLIVDEAKPKPLPNLDYKIVQGNSLVSQFEGETLEVEWNRKNGTKSVQAHLDQLQESLQTITRKQKAFFDTNPTQDKQQLKTEIRHLKLEVLLSQLSYNRQAYAHRTPIKNGLQATPKDKKHNLARQMQLATYDEALQKLKDLKENGKPLDYFDWRLDFPEVMNPLAVEHTGFDIVIGNPPWGATYPKEHKKIFKERYVSAQTIKGVQKGSLDTYTLFLEQAYRLAPKDGSVHFIVPISVTSSDSLTGLHKLIEENCSMIQISSYAVRPKPVFVHAVANTSIVFFKKTLSPCQSILSTKMYRKIKDFNLADLINNLAFIDVKDVKIKGRYPKISKPIEKNILQKIQAQQTTIGNLQNDTGTPIYYRFAGGRYFKVITNYPTNSSAEREIYLEKRLSSSIGAILSSSLFFWYYQIFSDNLNLKNYEIESFTIPVEHLTDTVISDLEALYDSYLVDIEEHANVRQTSRYANITEFKEYKIGHSKHIIDQIDDLICPFYGLSAEETEYIKNYEIEYRIEGGDLS